MQTSFQSTFEVSLLGNPEIARYYAEDGMN